MMVRWRIAAALLLSPAIAIAQRMAPLPPPCAIGTSGASQARSTVTRGKSSLGILPFGVDESADRAAYLSAGLASAIADRLYSALPNLEIVVPRATRRDITDDPTVIAGIGAELNTRHLLTGRISGSRDGIRVLVALYSGNGSRREWQKLFTYDSLGANPIVREVATEVAARVTGTVTPRDLERLAQAPTQNRAAFDWLLRGEAATNAAAHDRASNAFRRATQLDRGFVAAQAKLVFADAALVEEGVERSTSGIVLLKEIRTAATRAVDHDRNSPLAWLAEGRARLLEGRPTSSWRAAFDRALALNGRDPVVLEQYGLALAQTDEPSTAREMLRRAAALRAPGPEISTTLADLAIADKNDAEACGLLNQAIAADALYGPAWATRALLRSRHGDLRFAWADAETATQVGSALLGESAAAMVDLKARDTARARTRLGDIWMDLEARGTISVREGRAVATAFIAAGQISRAVDVLEAVRPRGPLYAATLRDPVFDRARRDPRFRALMTPSQAGPPEARLPLDIGSSTAPALGRLLSPVAHEAR